MSAKTPGFCQVLSATISCLCRSTKQSDTKRSSSCVDSIETSGRCRKLTWRRWATRGATSVEGSGLELLLPGHCMQILTFFSWMTHCLLWTEMFVACSSTQYAPYTKQTTKKSTTKKATNEHTKTEKKTSLLSLRCSTL